MELPNYIFEMQFLPHGARLPKRKKWWEGESKASNGGGTYVNRGYRPLNVMGPHGHMNRFPHSISNNVSMQNLSGSEDMPWSKPSMGEYRYWSSVEHPNSKLSWCRVCGLCAKTHLERKDHKGKGCGRIIEKALKIVSREDKCIICKAVTKHKKWGYPLCSESCRKEFMYIQSKPPTLVKAIAFVKAEDREKERKYNEAHSVRL